MTIKLASSVEGVIAEVAVKRGDLVRAGQVIARLDSALDEANVAFARAKATSDAATRASRARLEFARSQHTRNERLKSSNVVSDARLEETRADARVAEQELREAEHNQILAQLELKRAEVLLQQRTIKSPLDGIVIERNLAPGEYRNEQTPIVTIAQLSPLRIETFVPTAFFGQISLDSRAEIRPQEPVGGRYVAQAVVVDRVLDAASGSFGVRLELPNDDLALPGGLRCRIRFLAKGDLGLAR
ncbi:MAG: efflux RND transporter periplasmic adaptor subunit [Alphaproteobacteria bacterium]|nr:efflux RND transporter periplasmic adaptor subunit [Alphaproteobacteria bacterium]